MLLSGHRSKNMAVVIVRCHNWAFKSLPEWKRRGGTRENWFSCCTSSLTSLLLVPSQGASEAIFIMCPSTGRADVSGPFIWSPFNYPALTSSMPTLSFVFLLIPHFTSLSSCFKPFTETIFPSFFFSACSLPPSPQSPPFHLTPTQQHFWADLHC